jgi:hypothetical protein
MLNFILNKKNVLLCLINIIFITTKIKCYNIIVDKNSYSHSLQDQFVYEILINNNNNNISNNDGGFFIDLNSNSKCLSYDDNNFSNTYLLEKKYGWNGILIDAVESLQDDECRKKSIYITNNPNSINWIQFFDLININNTNVIDYLSINIKENNENPATKFPFDKIKFKIITIEFNNKQEQTHIDLILKSNGYFLIVSNINNHIENWYVNPAYVNMKLAKKYQMDGLKSIETFEFVNNFNTIQYKPEIEMKWDNFVDYREAVVDICYTNLFNDFKRDYRYTLVLEHASYEEGLKQIEEIENKNKSLLSDLEFIDHIIENNYYGNPVLYLYKDISIPIHISPSTFRYVKVASHIDYYFNPPHNNSWVVAEIGVGYGGQSQVLFANNIVSRYYLFDLPTVLTLAVKYLLHFNWIPTHRIHPTLLDDIEYNNEDNENNNFDINKRLDLCISAYAVSELPKKLQDKYLKHVLSRCERGYIIYNHFVADIYDIQEFANILREMPRNINKRIRIMNEIPNTSKGNKVLIWD